MARNIKGKNAKQAKQAELGLQVDATALYIRVSTQLQAEEGTSLDYQRGKLLEFCDKNGWAVDDAHIFVDAGISGKSTDRPKFQAMMQAAQDGKLKRVIATKLDRIARNLKDLLETVDQLDAKGCALIVLDQNFDTSNPSGKFFLQMMGAIAELERSMISDRVMSGKRQNASDGTFNGARIPYGYKYAGEKFAVHPGKAKIVREIFQRFVGCQTLLGIATYLNNKRIPSPTGKTWSHQGVRYVLTNGFYAGLAEWDGTKGHTAAQPAIVDTATYEAAAAKLATLTRRNTNSTKE